jgi:hypothetical protein
MQEEIRRRTREAPEVPGRASNDSGRYSLYGYRMRPGCLIRHSTQSMGKPCTRLHVCCVGTGKDLTEVRSPYAIALLDIPT